MRIIAFLSALLCAAPLAFSQQVECIDQVYVYLSPFGNTEVTPNMVLEGDLSGFDPAGFQINIIDDLDPSNGNILDGVGQFTYVVTYSGANFPGGGIDCSGFITSCPPLPDELDQLFVFSDAFQQCPAANEQSSGNPGSAGTPEVVCAGSTVEYFWEWAGPDTRLEIEVEGATSFERQGGSISVNWGTPGLGRIEFLLLDTSECSPFLLATVEVDVLPLPITSFDVPGLSGDTLFLCQGQQLGLSNTSQFAERYLWSFGDGNFSTRAVPTHAYSAPGTYTLELTVFNICECSDQQQLTVVVEDGSVPAVDCVSTLCAGGVSTYTTDSDCGTFIWSISSNGEVLDGGGPEDDYITVQWNTGPEGQIALAVEDCPTASNACDAPFEASIPILADSLSIMGKRTVCRAELTAYSLPAYEGASIQWSVSSYGSIVEGQGTAGVSVRWSNGPIPTEAQWVAVSIDHCYLGCQTEDTLSVDVRPELYVLGPIEACQGSTTSYEAFSRPGNAPVQANWAAVNASGDTVFLSPSPNSSVSIDWNLPPGDYQILAQPLQADDYCTAGYSRPLRVLSPPSLTGNLLGDTLICPGETYTYEVVAANPNIRFLWEVLDGGSISTQMGRRINLTFGPTPPYRLIVQGLDALGCAALPDTLDIEQFSELEIQGPPNSCPQTLASYTATAYGSVTYEWSISPSDAGTIVSGAGSDSVAILWHREGPAELSLQACNSSATYDVLISPAAIPAVIPPAAICPGQLANVQTTAPFEGYAWFDASGNLVSDTASPMLPPGFYLLETVDSDGCTANTTFRIASFEPPGAYITTPDPNRFCNIMPFARLFASETAAGYTYQWLHDGNPVGNDSPSYTATDYGNYQVEVTDANGCSALSNTIPILGCGAGGGTAPPASGCAPLLDVALVDSTDCQVRSYEAVLDPSYLPGSILWIFDDPGSGPDNVVTAALTTQHTFANPGYYRVQVEASFIDMNGDTIACSNYRVDTVFAAAHFQTDTTCAGQPLSFVNRSSFLGSTALSDWAWDFGDPISGATNFSTDESPSHTYASPGTYNVGLQALSSAGCQVSTNRDVLILGAPSIGFEAPDSRCAGQPIRFDADFSPEVIQLNWDFGDPASGSANTGQGRQTFHQYDTPGNYTVSVQAIGRYGCDSTFTREITIVANTLAGDIASTAPEACQGDTIMLTSPPGGIAWRWVDGSTDSNLAVTETGSYTLTLTDANGCTFRPSPQEVQFLELPTDSIRAVDYDELGLPAGYTYEQLGICEGEDVFLEVLGSPSYTYTWSDGQTGTQIEFSDARGNQLSEGNYAFEVTITNTLSGCSATIGPFEVSVQALPAPLVTASPAGLACEGTEVTYSVSNPDPDLLYVWSNGTFGSTLTTSRAGGYFVTAINEFGCEGSSNERRILSGPNTSLVPNGCYSRCLPDTLCLPDIPNVASYQWVFEGTPLGSPSSSPPELIATQSGSYSLDMVGDNGCSASSSPLNLMLFEEAGVFLGLVYIDLNGNGVIDGADSLYNGAQIQLLQNGLVLDSAAALGDSSYTFLDLPAGDYQLLLDSLGLPPELSPLYTQVDSSIAGCGRAFRVDWLLEIACQPDSSFTTLTGCGSVSFDGQVYSQDTLLSLITPGAQGCDTLELVDIRVLSPTDSTLVLGTCEGSSLTYEGVDIMAGQQQDFTFVNVAGCDSTVTVMVAALHVTDSTLMLSACEGSSLTYEGVDIMAGQQQDFTFVNAVGCDSTVTVMVAALPATDSTLMLSACEGSSLTYEGVDILAGQQQDFTFVNAVGCDSTVTVMVAALPVTDSTLMLSACEGSSLTYEGVDILAGQQQDFTFVNAAGCDSTVTVMVAALPATDSTLMLSACEGSSLTYEGVDILAGQQQDFTFVNAAGCDSIVTVMVAALPATDSTLMLSACEGSSLTYEGVDIPAGQQQDFTFVNAAGCDSIVTVMVAALPVTDSTLMLSACEGSSLTYEDVEIPAGQQQDFTFVNAAGCDSTVTVMVAALPVTDSTLMLSACEGSSLTYEGVEIMAGQQQDFTFVNAVGCDSIVTVIVAAAQLFETNVTLEACPGETIDFNGLSLLPGQDTSLLLMSTAGCDSLVNVTVTALPAIMLSGETEAACAGQADGAIALSSGPSAAQPLSYALEGAPFQADNTFTSLGSGNYAVAAQDANGCQETLALSVAELPALQIEVALDTATCEQPEVRASAIVLSGADGSLSLNWSNGDSGMSTNFLAPGQGQLTASNACGQLELAFDLPLLRVAGDELLYLPNAFSPNGDGRNDQFQGYLAQGANWLSFRLMVFDRWGNQLYETADPGQGWDGRLRGEPLNPGVFVYHLMGELQGCGQVFKIDLMGDVALLR